MVRLRGANWYAGCIFHSADLRVVTNVHETATWWSVKVKMVPVVFLHDPCPSLPKALE